MKVTLVPEQIEVDEADMDTPAVSNGFTVMVTALEVAGLPVTQAAFEVSTQVTTSLFAKLPVL